MAKVAKLYEKPDWRIITLLKKAKGFLSVKDYPKALREFRKANKLPMRKEDKLEILDQIQHWASYIEDYATMQDCFEQLCEIDLNVKHAQSLVDIYIKTNNTAGKKEFAEKVKEISKDDESDERILVALLAQCDSHDEVIERCREWLEKNPGDIEMSKRVISAHMAKGEVVEARKIADGLIERGYEDKIYIELHDMAKAVLDYETAKDYYLKYMEQIPKNTPTYAAAAGNLMIFASYSGVLTDNEYMQYAEASRIAYKPQSENIIKTNTNFFRKIKVGFVSYDFRAHSVGKFVMSLFDQISADSPIETFCYYTCPDTDDDFTAVIKQMANHFVYAGKFSNKQFREQLLNDNLDVLIDLNGQTIGHKLALLAERFAPIQISWMGFPFSSFSYNMDYIIGDYYSDPEDGETEKFCTEKVLRMEPCYMCFALQATPKIEDEPPMVKNGYVTFGNMSNVQKYSKEAIVLWKTVLERVPDSRLIIQLPPKEQQENFNKSLMERFEKFGLDTSRVTIGDWYGNDGYWRTYSERVDIMLDTIPFCGVTTGAEAIIAGVPIITFKHRMRHGRMSYDFNEQVGLGDLSASTFDEYAEVALKLSKDVDRLRDLRKSGREKALESPLFSTKIFRKAFDNAMQDIYLEYCSKNKTQFGQYLYDNNEGALLRDCMRFPSVLERRFGKDDKDAITEYCAEYLLMLTLLFEHLRDIYENDNGAAALLDMAENVAAKMDAEMSGQPFAELAKAMNKILVKFN